MAMGLSNAKRVFFIIVIVSVVAMLVMISEYYRTGAAIAFETAGADRITNSIVIGALPFDYSLSTKIQALTEYHLLCLGSYVMQTQAGRTQVRQFLRFGNGFPGGKIIFGQNNDGVVSDYLFFPGDMPAIEIELVFDSGLSSEMEGNSNWRDLKDMEGEMIRIVGQPYQILEAKVDTSFRQVRLRLIGPGGLIQFQDRYDDTVFTQGVEINGQTTNKGINGQTSYGEVMIIGAQEGSDEFGIYNIRYRPIPSDDLYIGKRQGLKAGLGNVLVNSDLNLFYLGSDGIPITQTPSTARTRETGPGVIKIYPRGDEQYRISFATREATYDIPLYTIVSGTMQLGDDDKRLVVKENVWINKNDYFITTSREDTQGRTNVLIFDRMDFNNKIVYIKDWKGGQKQVKFDASGNGVFIAGGHNYKLTVDMASPTHPIRVDLNGDGSIGTSLVKWVLYDGTLMWADSAGDIKYQVPAKFFEERTTAETASIKVAKSGSDLTMIVTSPSMISSGKGERRGSMIYGVEFVYRDDKTPPELTMFLAGSGGAPVSSIGASFGLGQRLGSILVTCEESLLQQRQAQSQLS